MFKNLRKKKKGFTLIELIIVIAILAILAAVAIPRLGSMTTKASRSADIASAKTIANAATIVIAEKGAPAEDFTNAAVTSANTNTNQFVKDVVAYLQSVPKPKTADVDNFTLTVSGSVIEVKVGDNTYFPAPEEE